MNRNKIIKKIKRSIYNTPFNRNYIADISLKKSLKEAAHHVRGLVIDVGCGEKPYEYIFRGKIKKYIGIDIPNAYPDDAREFIDLYGRIESLPFKDSIFDTVICTQVLEHIERPDKVFEEFARKLRDDGTLIITAAKTWEKRTGSTLPDYFRYTDDILRHLASIHKLKIIYLKECCGFFAVIGQLMARFLNNEFIYRKSLYGEIDKKPNIIAAIFVLPLIAVVQTLFLLLEKLYHSKVDTLFYILVARKVK